MQYDKELFETMPIPKAVAKNSIPAIISMMVVFVYPESVMKNLMNIV